MRIEIEDYRGWTIYFDTGRDKFYSLSQRDDTDKENKSFTAAKKAIDDYIKENTVFKPFKIQHGTGYSTSDYRIAEVIGIRKDGRFMIQVQGSPEPEQLSNYDEGSWFVYETVNDSVIQEIIKQNNLMEDFQKKHRANIDLLKASLKVKTMSQVRKELGQ